MMEIIIRDAQAGDVRQIQEVYYKTWLATYPNKEFGILVSDIEHRFKNTFDPEKIKKSEERINQMGSSERSLIAEVNGKIVGVSNFHKETSLNILRSIYVLPDHHRLGVGKKLFDEALRWFDPAHDIQVDVASYNLGAIAFYESLGFSATGEVFQEERFKMQSGGIIPEQRMIRKANKI